MISMTKTTKCWKCKEDINHKETTWQRVAIIAAKLASETQLIENNIPFQSNGFHLELFS